MVTKRKARQRHEKSATFRAFVKPGVRDGHREKVGRIVKIVLVAIGVFAMLLSVTTMACAGIMNQAKTKKSYELTGGVAATVNGVNIKEDSITEQIMQTKEGGKYDTDEKWAKYLVDSNQTPEELRKTKIKSLAKQYLIEDAEKKHDITVSDDELNDDWKDQVKKYDSEQAFIDQIKKMGMTEASYKSSIRNSLMQKKLKEEVAPEKDPSDQDIIDYVNKDISKYNDARRSSNILFKIESGADEQSDAKVKEKAQGVLDKINSGELTFEDAAEKYSEDDGSKKDKGDVGWDKLTTFVKEYQDALNNLAADQVSGLVKSTYGYHIIRCTGYFHVDGTVNSIDQIPKNMKEKISDTIKKDSSSKAYTAWEDDLVDKADIKINDMPSNVPYNVSLDGVKKTNDNGSAS
ncbi:PpiC-type peptidyl-prolyl cis-trans isomerase [Coriobacterium glomerans PW2]|uniref:PpiC-type peptidyl-prolyl cis-trans isomerase n=1 Tax=Coriobacterium glomerans (strain ATCC 49209 / DSM 20642 / JCM 10262 / PW2) TaxID=700015 RepID=F2N9A1_CORGP|nr:peptidylprolyl isomerase [Coriobacterium glomerans]AEB07849.1 PpiC-type peptidyl-prolyl cis-trans isomerase [Coriobacterium glomerans PW2]